MRVPLVGFPPATPAPEYHQLRAELGRALRPIAALFLGQILGNELPVAVQLLENRLCLVLACVSALCAVFSLGRHWGKALGAIGANCGDGDANLRDSRDAFDIGLAQMSFVSTMPTVAGSTHIRP